MHVVVVGGGVAGLAAAHDLVKAPGVDVTLLEADARLGGKVRTEGFAGLQLDAGPDAFLARRPEAVALCHELGLGDALVAPATTAASLWLGHRLRPLPPATLLGVPTDLVALARSGVLSPLGLARAAVEPLLPGRPLGADDAAVGALVRRRFGRETAERLIDPLVGGINAGTTAELSVDAVAPQIGAAARRHRSLTVGARRVLAGAGGAEGPVFLTLPGGLGRMVDALAASVAGGGAAVRTSTEVEALEPAPGGGWLVRTGRDGELRADAVVLAVPAFAAAPLLAGVSPRASGVLGDMEHATVVLVAMAWPAGSAPGPPPGSGFLVPRHEGHLMTACSWASNKWRHLDRAGQVVVRLSAGRMGDDRAAGMDDDDLVERLTAELGTVLGAPVAPSEVHVARWPRGFPQYRPGHLARMAHAIAGLPPGLALAGAALRGRRRAGVHRERPGGGGHGPGCGPDDPPAEHTVRVGWRRRGAAAVAGLVLAGGIAVAVGTSGGDGPDRVSTEPVSQILPGAEAGATPTTPAPTTTVPPTTTTAPIVLPKPSAIPVDPRAVEPAVVVGTIEIPRLNLKSDLHEGISLNTIDRGPSHWPGTALPGNIGNVVVAGHRVTKSRPFRHVDQLVVGDEIVFTVDGRRSVYRVTGTEVVAPDALHIAEQTPEPVATLFACHPPGSARFRYVVRAALEGPPTIPS